MPRSKRRGRNAEPGHGILSVPVSLSARISMEGSHASGNLDVHRRPGGRGGRGERRAARSEPRHRAIPEHRPGVGWLWPRHASGARALEPVARRVGTAALRAALWRRLLWGRVLRRRLPVLAPLSPLVGLLASQACRTRAPALWPALFHGRPPQSGSTGKRWHAVNVLAIAGTFAASAANNRRPLKNRSSDAVPNDVASSGRTRPRRDCCVLAVARDAVARAAGARGGPITRHCRDAPGRQRTADPGQTRLAGDRRAPGHEAARRGQSACPEGTGGASGRRRSRNAVAEEAGSIDAQAAAQQRRDHSRDETAIAQSGREEARARLGPGREKAGSGRPHRRTGAAPPACRTGDGAAAHPDLSRLSPSGARLGLCAAAGLRRGAGGSRPRPVRALVVLPRTAARLWSLCLWSLCLWPLLRNAGAAADALVRPARRIAASG